MRFRWIGFLTLWTFLSGPIFALPNKTEPVPSKIQNEKRPLAAERISRSAASGSN
ncbi:MAG: hypothetical protein K8T89_14495 [Planctomycetes bacterium]|nr:hypothetical protein [Planctomycetota bacterium]